MESNLTTRVSGLCKRLLSEPWERSGRPSRSAATEVLCCEIDEGSWGAGGHVVQFEQLKAAAKAQREAAAVQS